MIPSPSPFRAVLSGGDSFVYRARVESWLGSELLDDDVPMVDGAEESDITLRVPERITITVPRVVDGVNYAPNTARSTLGAFGQRLRILLGIDSRHGQTEWIQRGWFVIQDATADGDQITVNAVGLLALIDEARLVSPYQPTGTFGSTLRGLLEPAIPVDLTNAPADRSVPASINFDENRLDAVNALLDAWPAAGRINNQGVYVVTNGDADVVDTITDSSVILRDSAGSSRDDAYNCVVTRGVASDGGVVQGVAYDTSSGPHAYAGNFARLPVPYFFASPLLTTVAQCNTAAASVLARLLRESGPRFDLETVPIPIWEAGDKFIVTTADIDAETCIAERVSLSYTAGGGPMRLGMRAQ